MSRTAHTLHRPQAWAAILKGIVQGWLQRRTWPWVALVLLAFAALPIGMFWLRGPEAAQKVLVAVFVILVMVAWGMLVYALIVQNTATAARLVPGHVQRLREVLGLGWCAGLGLVAVLAWLRDTDPSGPVLVVGILMLAVALTVRWPWLAIVIWVVPALSEHLVKQAIRPLLGLPGIGSGLALLIAVLVFGWLLGGLLGAGDAGHLKRQARFEAWRRATQAGGMPTNERGTIWAWLNRAFSAPYQVAIDRLSRSPGPTVWPRLMLVFGPGADWRVHASWASGLAGLGIVAVAWLWFKGSFEAGSLRAGQIAGPAIGLASMALNPVMSLMMACARTRREQALVALLPGVPRGAALNRGLAQRQLQHFAVAWLLTAALEAALVTLVAPDLLPVVMAGLVGLWPMAALLCVDLSRLPALPNVRLGLVMFSFFGGAGLAVAAQWLLGWPLPLIALASALLTAGLLARGWYRLGRWPSALPACRLA